LVTGGREFVPKYRFSGTKHRLTLTPAAPAVPGTANFPAFPPGVHLRAPFHRAVFVRVVRLFKGSPRAAKTQQNLLK
jgi:hypothetical protein